MTPNFGVGDWVWHGCNYMKLRVWETITRAIKSNWKNRMISTTFPSHFLQWSQQHLIPNSLAALSDSGLIELAILSEWMWRYMPPNQARLDPNKKCAPPLPTSGGLQWWWHQSYSDEASKVGNSAIKSYDTHFAKPPIFFMFTLQAFLVGSYQILAMFLWISKG